MSIIQRGGRGDNAAARKCKGNRIIVESICIANARAPRPRGAISNPSGVYRATFRVVLNFPALLFFEGEFIFSSKVDDEIHLDCFELSEALGSLLIFWLTTQSFSF